MSSSFLIFHAITHQFDSTKFLQNYITFVLIAGTNKLYHRCYFLDLKFFLNKLPISTIYLPSSKSQSMALHEEEIECKRGLKQGDNVSDLCVSSSCPQLLDTKLKIYGV